ncbi:MAG: DegT/DnrJ/EryC1/StrS family aminotransferase [Lentisphaerae bacterium]|nr:DegT/DnrJ/EryC1/StrS family aminotransferase [Lentisphaerota bacterium]OQC17888.1 MAG: L-glutamine:2-deoxy-scyllo-inosose aminotransferase [Lentisphaerae bacterium ADurb.Bin082]HQL88164.1 DegT/DnrJ/EryC1/StrS family aminotransferase [Lentisphaeria bacterium]
MGILAVNGGTPVITPGTLKTLPWPPVCEETAEKIKELYLSRQWSFNSPSEQAFEKAFAEYQGAKHGIFMMNGTVTLEAALAALGVGPGDEVIIPGLTWIATAMSIRYVGAIPVFADMEPSTMALDPAAFEAAITPRTKAVIPVHLYGTLADLDRILAIANKHGIAVVEDCAHAQGGMWKGRGVGSWGAVGSFSFQQSKTLAAGESGICLTNDDALAERLYRFKHIGYSRYDEQGKAGTPPPAGLMCRNYRGLAIPALILHEQLPGLSALLKKYEEFYNTLAELTRDIDGFRLQAPGRLATRQSYYGLMLFFDGPSWDKVPREKLTAALTAEGRSFSATYGPVYKHLLFNMQPGEYRIADGGCPVCDHLCTRAFSMIHHTMYYQEAAVVTAEIIRKISDNRKELEA